MDMPLHAERRLRERRFAERRLAGHPVFLDTRVPAERRAVQRRRDKPRPGSSGVSSGDA